MKKHTERQRQAAARTARRRVAKRKWKPGRDWRRSMVVAQERRRQEQERMGGLIP